MLGPALLAASRSNRVRNLITGAPGSRRLVGRFVVGENLADALDASRTLVSEGLAVTLDHLGEDTLDVSQAGATRETYVDAAGPARRSRPGRTGRGLAQALRARAGAPRRRSQGRARERPRHLRRRPAGRHHRDPRHGGPHDGGLHARRSCASCASTSPARARCCSPACIAPRPTAATWPMPGSRVRLVKGAYAEPASVAYPAKADVDLAYVRCLKILMAGDGYPMVASHDPRMIELAGMLAERHGRAPGSYEYQMLHGIRTGEQRRLAAAGERVRVYVPYGADWYGYFMRRLAERPGERRLLPPLPRLPLTTSPERTPMDAVTQVPVPTNEPIHDYEPGSAARARLELALKEQAAQPGRADRHDRRRAAPRPVEPRSRSCSRTTTHSASAPCATRPRTTRGQPSPRHGTPPRAGGR